MRSELYSGGEAQGDPAKLWWVFVVTGSLWLIFSLLLFRFSYASVTAISILIGVVCIAAAIEELVLIPTAHGWWRLARVVLAVAFAVIAIVAFVHPGDTFSALAAIFAFYLLLNGVLSIVLSLTGMLVPMWLGVVSGLAQVGLAFWAAGDFGHKEILLLVFIGAGALIHGLVQIVLAFHLRSLRAVPA
ncbi:MAG TPA: DUF308 domain-containing protein [Gaiellaceae bacterium]|jgi:uncharacterized membrane protein HdeD (DUF308 family)|nr:DUF308 domain-containing protein [Gaiellaceae bacterium]